MIMRRSISWPTLWPKLYRAGLLMLMLVSLFCAWVLLRLTFAFLDEHPRWDAAALGFFTCFASCHVALHTAEKLFWAMVSKIFRTGRAGA